MTRGRRIKKISSRRKPKPVAHWWQNRRLQQVLRVCVTFLLSVLAGLVSNKLSEVGKSSFSHTVTVEVQNPDGQVATLRNAFTYTQPTQ